jgi:hypothetical protein
VDVGGEGQVGSLDDAIFEVAAEQLRVAPRDLVHSRGARFGTVNTEDGGRKVEFTLHSPYLFVGLGWEQCGWVTDCDPPYWNNGICFESSIDVNNTVDPHFGARFDLSARKHRNPGGEEHVIIDDSTIDMTMGSYKNMISQTSAMTGPPTKHSVLHHDAFLTQLDRPAIRSDHRPEEHSASLCESNLATHDRSRSHIHIVGENRTGIPVLDQHNKPPQADLEAIVTHLERPHITALMGG